MKIYKQEIIRAFLSDPQMRPLLNWRGIEKAAGLDPFRIKNLVGQGTALSEQDTLRLAETLSDLGFEAWARDHASQLEANLSRD